MSSALARRASNTQNGALDENGSEDWTQIGDPQDRKRLQNRLAQRNHRAKMRDRLQELERIKMQMARNNQNSNPKSTSPAKQTTEKRSSRAQSHRALRQDCLSEKDLRSSRSQSGDAFVTDETQTSMYGPFAGFPADQLSGDDAEDIDFFDDPAAVFLDPKQLKLDDSPAAFSDEDISNALFAAYQLPFISEQTTPCRMQSVSQTSISASSDNFVSAPVTADTGPFNNSAIGAAASLTTTGVEGPAASSCSLTPEQKFMELLLNINKAGFESIDTMIMEYYSSEFRSDSVPYWAQKHSRQHKLPLILASLHQKSLSWPQAERQTFNECIRGMQDRR